jgi:hypothetical protein
MLRTRTLPGPSQTCGQLHSPSLDTAYPTEAPQATEETVGSLEIRVGVLFSSAPSPRPSRPYSARPRLYAFPVGGGRQMSSWAPVAHTCNPSSSGGRDQEDCGSKPALANSLRDSISKIGGMAQMVACLPSKCEAEFKSQSSPLPCKKERDE